MASVRLRNWIIYCFMQECGDIMKKLKKANCYRIVDKNGNPYDDVTIKVDDTCGCNMMTFVIDDEKDGFTDNEIYLIMELLHKALDYGGSYKKMKEYVELLDKLNERNCSK